jgi:NAD(P)-dependent dehydrogenase (short-subunit alcohol dehydrogenase family)
VSERSQRLAGRRALVTGAAQGLGRAFALALAEEGAAVAVCDVKRDVEAVPAELEARGAAAWAQVADVTKPDQVRSFVDGAAGRLGGIDLLVNNAGVVRVTYPASDSWEQTLDDYEAVEVNFKGSFLVGRAAIPYLVRGGGDIVNVTTDHVHTCGYPVAVSHDDAPGCRWATVRRPALGNERFDVFDASKWSLKGLTSVWARALAEHGVRVNSFGMGHTDTPMLREHLRAAPPPPGTLDAADVAAVLVELVAEAPPGRTGDSVQCWPGHPVKLPPVGLDGDLALNTAPPR